MYTIYIYWISANYSVSILEGFVWSFTQEVCYSTAALLEGSPWFVPSLCDVQDGTELNEAFRLAALSSSNLLFSSVLKTQRKGPWSCVIPLSAFPSPTNFKKRREFGLRTFKWGIRNWWPTKLWIWPSELGFCWQGFACAVMCHGWELSCAALQLGDEKHQWPGPCASLSQTWAGSLQRSGRKHWWLLL